MAQFHFLRSVSLCFGALCLCLAAAQAQTPGQPLLPPQQRLKAKLPAAKEPAGGAEGLFGSAPFPASAAADAAAQRGVFSYVSEGGFIRLSFAQANHESKAGAGKGGGVFYGLAELDLKPGWKTYWRNPGASGLAPQITIDGGAAAEILFPAPQLLQTGDEWNYGYANHIILPFRVNLPAGASPAAAKQQIYTGSLTLGICNKICMPQKLAFRFSPAAVRRNKEQSALLEQTLSALPKAANKNFGLISAKFARDGAEKQGLQLKLAAPAQAEIQLALDGGEALQLGRPELRKTEARCLPQQAKGEARFARAACPRVLTYYAPLLFGAPRRGAKLYYTAAAAKNAVAGAAVIQ